MNVQTVVKKAVKYRERKLTPGQMVEMPEEDATLLGKFGFVERVEEPVSNESKPKRRRYQRRDMVPE